MMFASFRRWNMVVIVGVLLSIMLSFITACGSTATTSTAPTATNTPTPEPLSSEAAKQRFTDMGIAIKNKDYEALYSTTSMEYQNSHTQQQMIADIQQMIYAPNSDGTDITDFAIGQITIGSRVSDNATIANGEMSFTFANGHINSINPSLIAENGAWRIADLFYHLQ